MRIPAALAALFLATVCTLAANAQNLGPNPGVTPIRQIDRAEVRVTRVELQPGAVHSVHQHDDVRFHLFIPISGKIELTIGSAKPVDRHGLCKLLRRRLKNSHGRTLRRAACKGMNNGESPFYRHVGRDGRTRFPDFRRIVWLGRIAPVPREL